MMERGWLGEKSGQGFYKRVGKDKEIYAIDLKTLGYHPAAKVRFPSAETARNIDDLGQRLRVLVAGSDRVGTFLWKLFGDLFLYVTERVPEISDRIVEIDRAMRWGYANKLGPFELWDALGFENVAHRIEKEGHSLPSNIQRMRANGATSLYQGATKERPEVLYFDFLNVEYKPLEPRPGIIVLSDLKRTRGTIKQNSGASLVDLGDGVVCVEFHSKMNSIGE